MRLHTIRLEPQEQEYVDLITTADLHVGSPQFDDHQALKHRKYIEAHPDRYTWSLADDFENATRRSVGAGVYEQTLRPKAQREYLREWYRDMADAGKVLGIHESNHSIRSVDDSDFSPQEWLADKLGVEWLGGQAVLKIQVGKQAYLIHSMHGAAGGTTPSAIFLSLNRTRQIVQGCDAYVHGHVHQTVHTTVNCYLPGTTRLTERPQWMGTAGSFMRYGGYAEAKGLQVPYSHQWCFRMHKQTHTLQVLPV